MNGRPGNRITHARGLRQGDPISPMLFVIVMESLNSLFKEADRRGALSPVPGRVACNRASLYADDVVLLVAPTQTDLACVQQVMLLFAGASGLITNINKCVVSPISCSEDQVAIVQQVFPCTLTPFPCKYLGIPLSLRKLRRCEEQVLVD